MSADHPLKWLLSVLPYHVPAEQLPFLMKRYQANKKAYERQIAIRALERKIKNAQHWTLSDQRTIHLARWQAKLDKLKEESSE